MKRKRVFKSLIVMLTLIIIFLVSACTYDCGRGLTFNSGGWELRLRSGRIYLSALNDESLVEDGILTIFERVGAHRIYSFGNGGSGWITGTEAVKVVVPAGIRIEFPFWTMWGGGYDGNWRPIQSNVKYVELLCNTFEKVITFDAWAVSYLLYNDGTKAYLPVRTIIIPDGSSDNFINKIKSLGYEPERFNFIEKSNFKGVNNNG